MKTANVSYCTECGVDEVSFGSVTRENFFRTIMYSLGLDSKESDEVSEELFVQQRFNTSDTYEARINLAKLVVRHCIHRISSRIFTKRQSEISEASYFPYQWLLKMPLSIRTVYTLFTMNGFTENDIAFILNIDLSKVRERLSRATHLVNQIKATVLNH